MKVTLVDKENIKPEINLFMSGENSFSAYLGICQGEEIIILVGCRTAIVLATDDFRCVNRGDIHISYTVPGSYIIGGLPGYTPTQELSAINFIK